MGNTIIEQLEDNGWKITAQYCKLPSDKDIDFDTYILTRKDDEIHFEWDTWLEWKITGSEKTLTELSRKYAIPPSE